MNAQPKKIISIEEAKELQANWQNNQGEAISEILGFEDAYEFVFTLEELQEYLDYVREKSREQKVKDPGIRICLGSFPANGKQGATATIFLTATKSFPTEKNTDGDMVNNYEIEPFHSGKGGFPPNKY